jgi:hypothetical protein
MSERRRPTLDAHDDQERQEILVVLGELPKEHAAWTARRNGADAIELARMVGRKDLVDKLTKAWLDGHARALRRS